jgi:hypothetical protein
METQDQEHFSQIVGARINFSNVTIPYALLSAHRNALTLSCMGEDYVFPKDLVISMTKYRGLFGVGLCISHSVPLYPEFVVFWVSVLWRRTKFESLKRRLEALGYEVNE